MFGLCRVHRGSGHLKFRLSRAPAARVTSYGTLSGHPVDPSPRLAHIRTTWQGVIFRQVLGEVQWALHRNATIAPRFLRCVNLKVEQNPSQASRINPDRDDLRAFRLTRLAWRRSAVAIREPRYRCRCG